MRLTYIGPASVMELGRQRVARGCVIDVPDDVGKSLLEQPDNWELEPPKTARILPADPPPAAPAEKDGDA